MRLLLDHNVPDSVADVFRSHGHEVVLVKDILPSDSPDELISTITIANGWILVSCDGDFRQIRGRMPHGHRERFSGLNRISLACAEPQAAARIETAMSLIEFELDIAQRTSTRLFILIQSSGIKTHR